MRQTSCPSILAFRALVPKQSPCKEELNQDLIKRLLEISNNGLITYVSAGITS